MSMLCDCRGIDSYQSRNSAHNEGSRLHSVLIFMGDLECEVAAISEVIW